MKAHYPPLPSRDDLLALLRAALTNAKGLLDDAELLADARRFPRALALATLSWEELSKADLCVPAAALTEITADYFWEHFRDHEGKLARVHAFGTFMQPKPLYPTEDWIRNINSMSKSSQNLKERSLYVDYRRGKILTPSQVTERVARKQIKAVREALIFAEKAFSEEPARMMFTELNSIAGPLKNSMIAEPDATAAALQEAIRDGSLARIQSLAAKYANVPDD